MIYSDKLKKFVFISHLTTIILPHTKILQFICTKWYICPLKKSCRNNMQLQVRLKVYKKTYFPQIGKCKYRHWSEIKQISYHSCLLSLLWRPNSDGVTMLPTIFSKVDRFSKVRKIALQFVRVKETILH